MSELNIEAIMQKHYEFTVSQVSRSAVSTMDAGTLESFSWDFKGELMQQDASIKAVFWAVDGQLRTIATMIRRGVISVLVYAPTRGPSTLRCHVDFDNGTHAVARLRVLVS